jgi:CRISPR-associated protein Csm5
MNNIPGGITITAGVVKRQRFDAQRIQITSPILHIGSAVSRLSPFEYVQTSDRVYLPQQNLLAKTLLQRGAMSEYIQRIHDQQPLEPLLSRVLSEDWQTAKSDGEPIFPRHLQSQKWAERITDLRPMIRNGMGQLYIPGSAIKGAIRTAIAYHLLKHSDRYNVPKPQGVSAIENKLRESMGDLKRKAKFADDSLFMNRLFHDFDLVYQDKPVSAREGPNTDFLRSVSVSDSQPLLPTKTTNAKGQPIYKNLPVAVEVLVSSHFPDGNAKYRASIYTEMVRSVDTEFTLSVDQEMLSWFRHSAGMQIPFQSVADILSICQEFAQDQWDFEHDYWEGIQNKFDKDHNLNFDRIRKIYEPQQCPFSLRVGWASGMPGTTVNLLLPDDLWAAVRDQCGIKAPGFEAPKSRRTVVDKNGEIKLVPGWVKFNSAELC